ncbi:MAG: hypothetical protein SOZ58_06175 [Prevotella sp.]|nr:hypothetical protein [Prevotella sp.]
MNKVTLSVAALAAIGGSAQAAESTDVTLSNEVAYQNLTQGISKAILALEDGYHAKVKEDYKALLSALQKKVDDAKDTVSEKYNELNTELEEYVAGAIAAEKPWDAKDGLVKYYSDQLNAALAAAASVMSYSFDSEFIKDTKAAYDNDVKESEDIKAAIDGFDVTDVKGYASKESALKSRIDALKTNLGNYTTKLQTDNDKYVANKAANAAFETAYNNAETAYNKAIDQIGEIFTTDGYAALRQKALGEINTVYQNNVVKAYKENSLADGSNTTEKVNALVSTYLTPAETQFTNIVSKYQSDFDRLETYHTQGLADITTLNDRLKKTTDDLKKYSGEPYKLDQKTTDVNAINTEISALQTKVDGYISNNGADYASDKTAIESKLTALENATKDGIADAKGYEVALNAITALETSLTTAITNAGNVSYVDGSFTYKPADYITTTAISKLIDNSDTKAPGLKQQWATLYKNGQTAETDNTFDGSAVTSAISQYSSDIATAKAAYEKAAKLRDERAALVESLDGLDADVTLDGDVPSSLGSYGDLKRAIQGEVSGIQDKLDAAKNLKDKAHINKIKEYTSVSIGKKVAEVEALVAAYGDTVDEEGKVTAKGNKTMYYENLNIAAAQNIIDQAEASVTASSEAIGDMTIAGTGLDSDTQQKALKKVLDDIKTNISKISSEYIAKTKAEFEKDMAGYATKAVASLSPVIKDLNKYAEEIKALEGKIAAQEANFNAYKELMKADADPATAYVLKTDVAGSISTARGNVQGTTAEAALDASQKYYLGQLTGYETELSTLVNEINGYYYAGTMEANKTAASQKVTTLKTNVENVSVNYGLNNTNHTTQLGLASELQKLWNTKYTEISETDVTSNKDNVLKSLDSKLQDIINFKKDVNDAWGKGESKSKNDGFVANEAVIRKDINDIYDEWNGTDGWRKVLVADNNTEHEVFMSSFGVAKAKFDAAIKSLEAFSKIKNADTKHIMNSDAMIDTHKAIYEYADKLRQLLSDAQDALDDANNGTAENPDPTKFDNSSFIKSAEDYTSEINGLLDTYRSGVNNEAYKTHIQNIKDAVEKVVLAQYAIKDYDKSVLNANYLKGAEDLIAVAQKAANLKAETTDGVNVSFTEDKAGIDAEFAVKIDEYVNTAADATVGRFASELDGLVSTGKNNAADAQFEVLAKVISDLYTSETNDINGFVVADKNFYLNKLVSLYADTYTAATNQWSWLSASTDKVDYLANWSNNPLNDYKANDKNSQIWIDANTEHLNNTADATAQEAIAGMLADADRSYEITAGGIFELYGPHHPVNPISGRLDEIADKLDEFEAKNAQADGHVALQSEVKTYTDDLATLLATLQVDAIDYEFTQLGIEIDKVKEHYNKLVAATPADKLGELKTFEDAIQGHYDLRDNMKTAWGKLKDAEKINSFSKFKSGLIGLASDIFATGNELIAGYDKEGTVEAEAVAAVQAEQTKVTEALDAIDAMLKAYPEDLKSYQDEYDSLKGILDITDGLFESNAGSISFYKDNLIFDYNNLAGDIEALNNKVEPEYDACVLDGQIYDRVIAKLNGEGGLSSQIETAYNEVKGYDIEAYYNYLYVNYKQQINDKISQLNNRFTKLTTAEESSYNAFCNTMSSNIKSYERRVKVAQADVYSTEFANAKSAAEDAINDRLYGSTTRIEINNEVARLTTAKSSVADYLKDAEGGYVYRDILTGNYIGYGKSIDFVADAEGFDLIESTLLQLVKDAEALKAKAEEKAYIQGDANNDGDVDITDYDEVLGWILSAKKFADLEEAKAYGGDVNVDKKFNVGDLTCISNIIFKDGYVLPQPERASRRGNTGAEPQLTIANESEETTIFGKTVRMAISLDNSQALAAGQLDITLPQGMKLAGQSLTDRSNGHNLLANELGNGTYRLVASTVENNEFIGSNGALILLDVEVGSDFNGGDVTVDNIVFSDTQGNCYEMSEHGSIILTGIDSIEAATMKERIYSVGGQVMKTVKKGINIIKGENGAKKVVSNK